MATDNLANFYQHVETAGKLRTKMHAERYSRAVLQTLGLSLSRGVKQALAKALPQPLGSQLSGVFWLIHFRDTNMSAIYFQDRVARRSGNTDKFFARFPILAVFSGLQQIVPADVQRKVEQDLPPEIAALWQEASALKQTAPARAP